MHIGALDFTGPTFHEFVRYIPSPVAIFDQNMCYVAASDRWIADYRLDNQDVIGRSHYDIFPEIPERWRAMHRRCLAGETLKSDADSFERADGGTDRLRWRLVPCRDATGEVCGLVLYTELIPGTRDEAFHHAALANRSTGAIIKMARIRDPFVADHEDRVSQLAVAIGREIGWDDDRVDGLRMGGAIHDIGKVNIPVEILNRPGKLSIFEFDMIKTHPQVGGEIIAGIDYPWPIRAMILQHHERLDGSGYPNGLAGDEIALEARVLGIADVVEAMASHRPYRPALGVEAALQEIQGGRGVTYDTAIVDACVKAFRESGFQWMTPS